MRRRRNTLVHDWSVSFDPGRDCPCVGCRNRIAFIDGPTPPGWRRGDDGSLHWETGIYRTGIYRKVSTTWGCSHRRCWWRRILNRPCRLGGLEVEVPRDTYNPLNFNPNAHAFGELPPETPLLGYTEWLDEQIERYAERAEASKGSAEIMYFSGLRDAFRRAKRRYESGPR